ncbi:hypothetical protein ASG43_02700 [Aureimonas sp. Leaf454]|nr:hypothetical protein ASG43_02700 [Aureimonas sp. Leaf454]
MSALSTLPLVLTMGGMIDIAQQYKARSKLQSAADSAIIAASRSAPGASIDDMNRNAKIFLEANYGTGAQGTVKKVGDQIVYNISATVPYNFLTIFGMKASRISVNSTAEAAGADMDIVLILDNSLSMIGDKRIVELRKAANQFISTIEAMKSNVQIAIIPFDNTVFAGPGIVSQFNSISERSSVQRDGKSGPAPSSKSQLEEERDVSSGVWSGCIEDRSMDYDTNGIPADITNKRTLYPRKRCDDNKLQSVFPLSKDYKAARSLIDRMKPNGLTNNVIGLQWAMEAFTPQAPLTGSNPRAKRIAMLMTDGENTNSRWDGLGSRIDARMRIACKALKDADVILYTINLMEGDQKLLRDCATSPDYFFDIDLASQLTSVFQQISKRLAVLRIVH